MSQGRERVRQGGKESKGKETGRQRGGGGEVGRQGSRGAGRRREEEHCPCKCGEFCKQASVRGKSVTTHCAGAKYMCFR